MQLRQAQAGPGPGLVSTGRGIVQAEGAGALWKGLTPAVLRGLLYGGLRLGLYSPTKLWLEQQASQLNSGGSSNSSSSSGGFQASGGSGTSGGSSSSKSVAASSSSTSTKLLAGTLSGGVAAVVCSPTELVKVRLQAVNSPHKSAWAAVEAVVASDGVAGLWKGATPGLVRASVLTASQCATYDETKRWVMSTTGWGDTTITHLACSLVTGLASTTATNPVDVVKTHMFMGGSKFSGPLQCTAHLYRAHGAAGFMRGWWANYSRLGPQTCVTFVVAEQLRRLAGLQAL